MEPLPASAERSVRRSRTRARVLIMLASLGEAYASQLARAANVDRSRLKDVMEGRRPFYSPELSLLGLGLAERVATPSGRVFRITARGRRKARSLTSRRKRRFEVVL